MDTLTVGQYELVYNVLSLTIAAMFAAGLFFWGGRWQVAPRYRPALLVSAVVVFIAGYHYFRIFESWKDAFELVDGAYVATAVGFNEAYRYADWLITVPLLLIELIAVLALSRSESVSLFTRLTIASVAMLILGYPGEVSSDPTTKWIFWILAMIPFIYILWVLFGRLGQAVASQGGDVPRLLGRARALLVISWWVYPIAFLLPVLGIAGSTAQVGLQIGYSIADLTAKALFGIVIYQIARAKSENDGYKAGELQAAA